MKGIFELAAQQRHAWSAALFVGLFLVLVGNVPFLPVVAGCLLAVAISVWRAWPHRGRKVGIR